MKSVRYAICCCAALTLFLAIPTMAQDAKKPKYATDIPTPRWTAYDENRFDIKMSGDVPMATQERAYTSPIWYTP